uniref:Uncharacterized protein n=1 Tax=Avena sativa TaxID=4498 RepID=A0ACD5ZG36_AVESA
MRLSSRVRVVRVTRVHPARGRVTGTDDHELPFFDAMQVSKIPIQLLFLFDGPDLPPFPSMVSALRSSLADCLAVFFPLAGELAFRRSSGAVVLDCSSAAASSGVRFVEAEYLGGADDMRRMARQDEHDTEAFIQLVPELDVAQLPAPVLAVQVTRGQGAVAVGVSMHHAVADGLALWQFMRAWSTATREGSPAAAGLVPPTFDRGAILRHPMAAELYRMVLRMWAPELPLLSPQPSRDDDEMVRRTFVLTADRIQALKQHIGGGDVEVVVPTTYVAVLSLAWVSIIHAKSMDHAVDAYFMAMADCRRRMRPPLGDGYFGNCIRGCLARANVGDLCGEGGLARAAAAIQEGIREVVDKEDPLEGMERLPEVIGGIPKDRLTTGGSSHRFMAYETDFGWGAPTRVEIVSMFKPELIMLHGARDRGAVQVSLELTTPIMEAFATTFLSNYYFLPSKM